MPRKASLKAIQATIKKLEAIAEELKRLERPGASELKAVVARFKLTPADIKLALEGRDLRPKWVVELMRQGKKLDDLPSSSSA